MLAVANVGLRRFLRERSNVFFVFVLPFLIILLVGLGFGSVSGSTIAVAGADTEIAQAVVANLPEDQVRFYDTAEEAIRAVEETVVAAAAVFPSDGSESIRFLARAGAGLDMRAELEEAVALENQRIALVRQAGLVGLSEADVEEASSAVPPIPLTIEEQEGEVIWGGLNAFDVSALTQVILFMFLSALTASQFLIQDRDLGMARRKASAPISVRRLVAGETLGRFWISMFQAILIVVVSAVLFGVDWGDPLATGLVLILFALVATGAGVFLGSAMDNAEAAGGVGVMIGIVLAALGGAMAPVEIFPDVMQTVARFTPHFWAIEGLKVSVAGGDVSEIGQSLAMLTAIAGSLLILSAWFYRRRVFTNR